jgi:hypothetical protein
MEFIVVDHIPAKKALAHSSHINVRIESGISHIVSEDELPFNVKIKRILGDEIWYECELGPGGWMGHPWFEGCYLEISSKTGKILHKTEWHPLTHGTSSDIMFYLWTLQNPMNCGIVVGSNDGTYGGYLVPFLERNVAEMTLVEASERIFNKAKEKYKRFFNVKFLNHLVTPLGTKEKFYELSENSSNGGNLGFTNSVYRHMVEMIDDKNIIENEMESISLNDLILETGYDKNFWLFIDAEGLDGELIESLDFSLIPKPKIIIWERGFGCDNSFCSPYLEKNGYTIYEDINENDMIAIQK